MTDSSERPHSAARRAEATAVRRDTDFPFQQAGMEGEEHGQVTGPPVPTQEPQLRRRRQPRRERSDRDPRGTTSGRLPLAAEAAPPAGPQKTAAEAEPALPAGRSS